MASHNGRRKVSLKIVIGKNTGGRLLGVAMRKWVYNITVNLKETDSAEGLYYCRALVNAALNLWVS